MLVKKQSLSHINKSTTVVRGMRAKCTAGGILDTMKKTMKTNGRRSSVAGPPPQPASLAALGPNQGLHQSELCVRSYM